MKIVTSAQMTALEQASEQRGVSTDTLMENAGLAVAEAARKELGGAAGMRVLVLVGPGNNGADGLVAARHLRRWGAEVTAFVVTGRPQPDPKMELAQSYGVAVQRSSGDAGMGELDRLLGRCRLVIDAVLGTGRSRPLEGSGERGDDAPGRPPPGGQAAPTDGPGPAHGLEPQTPARWTRLVPTRM